MVIATFKGIGSGEYKRHFFGGKVNPNCVDIMLKVATNLNGTEGSSRHHGYLQQESLGQVSLKNWYEKFNVQLTITFCNINF